MTPRTFQSFNMSKQRLDELHRIRAQPREVQPEKIASARKRLEDMKMAREIGVPVEDIL
jgi:hypothetical protein